MHVFGQLDNAQLENKTTDYTASVAGRIWFNLTTIKYMMDDGSLVRALLRNDGHCIIGNSGTASQNIRLHRGASGVLQFVSGADSTAEGSLSTALKRLSFSFETYTVATKPAAGNTGRVIFVSDFGSGTLFFDNGSTFISLAGVVGIAPWDAGTTYATGDLVSLLGILYRSKTNGNLNNVLTDTTNWELQSQDGAPLAKTGNYTVLYTDTLITGDTSGGAFTLTLPSAATTKGKQFYIVQIGTSSNPLTIASSDLINGETSQTLIGAMATVIIKSNGTTYYVF